jgi:hypothetical protein
VRQLLRLLVKRQPAVVVHKPDCEHHIAAPPARAVGRWYADAGRGNMTSKMPLASEVWPGVAIKPSHRRP